MAWRPKIGLSIFTKMQGYSIITGYGAISDDDSVKCAHSAVRDTEYRTGRALVNPLELKLHLNKLRDQMFDKRSREARDDSGSRYHARQDRR